MKRHLYVTRAAAIAYQRQVGGGFEAARRALTMRLLALIEMTEAVDEYHTWTVYPYNDAPPFDLCARVQPEGPLLVVTQLTVEANGNGSAKR